MRTASASRWPPGPGPAAGWSLWLRGARGRRRADRGPAGLTVGCPGCRAPGCAPGTPRTAGDRPQWTVYCGRYRSTAAPGRPRSRPRAGDHRFVQGGHQGRRDRGRPRPPGPLSSAGVARTVRIPRRAPATTGSRAPGVRRSAGQCSAGQCTAGRCTAGSTLRASMILPASARSRSVPRRWSRTARPRRGKRRRTGPERTGPSPLTSTNTRSAHGQARCGHGWVRTSDPSLVRRVLFR